MPLLLPLSPNVSPQLTSTLDLQRALFQVSTFTSMDQAQGAIDAVAAAVRPYRSGLEQVVKGTTTFRKEMRYFGFLGNGNADGARLALAEIAMHPKTLQLLCQSPDTLEIVANAAGNMKVDAEDIHTDHLKWIGAPSGGSDDSPLSAWGQVTYWLSGIASPKNWLAWASAASLAPEFGYWASTGQTPTGFLAASSAVLAGALYGMKHRNSAKQRLYAAAAQSPLNFEAVWGYFGSFNRVIPTADPLPIAANDGDVIETIRRSSAAGGKPKLSIPSTLRLATDFLSLGSATVEGLKKSASKDVYNRLAQAIGVGTLSRTGWQPTILNAERLEQVAEYRRQRKNVIFVSNHRSHLDILLAVALLRDFDIRFVAKDDLLSIPVLGDILRLAEHFTVDREHDDKRLDKVMAWGVDMFHKGMSPFFFIEGTRLDTPNRSEEVGMRPPEIGAATLAAMFPKNTVIVPIVSYGFGSLLRKSEMKALSQGTMLHQPTMTSILEPIDVSQVLDADPALSEREEVRLNSLLWGRMWRELSLIQAYMNDLMAKGARAA
ncbi:MAG TPA: lysophospholipid acyltransferase family protein [bacterium]|nr:lysophospholipid acyltransferase family protein [bacterium]